MNDFEWRMRLKMAQVMLDDAERLAHAEWTFPQQAAVIDLGAALTMVLDGGECTDAWQKTRADVVGALDELWKRHLQGQRWPMQARAGVIILLRSLIDELMVVENDRRGGNAGN